MTKIEKVIQIIQSLDQTITQFVPSENNLMIRTGFSRNTVRVALGRLVGMGVLIPVHGKGYILNEKTSPLLRSYKDQYGDGHETIFLKKRDLEMDFGGTKNKKFVQLIKVRYKNNEPFILAYQNVPFPIYLKLDEKMAEKSLYEAIRKCGEKISYANKRISYIPTPLEVSHLMPRMEKKCLLLESTTYNKYNQIIEISHNYYYPDDFRWQWTEKSFK